MVWVDLMLAREIQRLTEERMQRRRERIRLSTRHRVQRRYGRGEAPSRPVARVSQAVRSAAHTVASWLL
jgi:hypothetical protein